MPRQQNCLLTLIFHPSTNPRHRERPPAVKDAMAQWFAAQASNAKGSREQLIELLYLEDTAERTSYSKYRSRVDEIINGVLQDSPSNLEPVGIQCSQPDRRSVASKPSRMFHPLCCTIPRTEFDWRPRRTGLGRYG